MSDDFDKEAEREKLREKLEGEEEDRERTRQMSELLLQGATMTNRHCDECGSPIFRQNDREFCPTCGTPAGNGEAAEPSGTSTNAAETPPADGTASGAEPGDGSTGESEGRSTTETQSPSGEASGTPRDGSAPARTPDPSSPSPSVTAPADGQGDDLGAASVALAGKVRALAEAAAATEDVGRTRDLLAATREAAEALEAVERARR